MKSKLSVLIAITLELLSCSNSENENSVVVGDPEPSTLRTTWIQVPDTLTNFEALLSTNHLYYIEHMSPEHESHGSDYWKYVDTLKSDSWTLTRLRKGVCKTSADSVEAEICIEQQEHVINKKIDMVVKFTGAGSGYLANIDFVYNQAGLLIQYRTFDEVAYLNYSSKGKLNEVLMTEIHHGIQKEVELIKFK